MDNKRFVAYKIKVSQKAYDYQIYDSLNDYIVATVYDSKDAKAVCKFFNERYKIKISS